MNLSIGILLSNTDRSEFAARFENDAAKTATLLRRQRPAWSYTIYRTIDGELPAAPGDHDGYAITGSPASVNRLEVWMPALFDFIRAAHSQQIALLGLCFGHQVIAHALGGRVECQPQWGLGVAKTTFTEAAQWMQPQRDSLQLHAAHEDQVTDPPPGARILGGSEFCPCGAMAIGRHVFSTQYHPEFPPRFMRALIADKIGPKLGTAVTDEALRQLAFDTTADADVFAQWAVQFFAQAGHAPAGTEPG